MRFHSGAACACLWRVPMNLLSLLGTKALPSWLSCSGSAEQLQWRAHCSNLLSQMAVCCKLLAHQPITLQGVVYTVDWRSRLCTDS